MRKPLPRVGWKLILVVEDEPLIGLDIATAPFINYTPPPTAANT
jgi:hypothetical protein